MINNYSYDPQTVIPTTDLTFASKAEKYNYTEIYSKEYKQLKNLQEKEFSKKPTVMSLFNVSMGQSHHFTLTIDGLWVNGSMKHEVYGNFLPIKSLMYKPISIESTHLNFGIFADFPIIHKRKMGSLQVTLNDTADNVFEQAVLSWFDSCQDTSTGFVKPMGEIVKQAHYKEFDNVGKLSKHYYFEVIPDGDVSSTRGYENASLKEILFNVLIVSPIHRA